MTAGAVNPSISKALEEARKLVQSLESYEESPANHAAVLKQTDAVRNALEQPYDVITRILEHLAISGALHTAIGIKSLQSLPENGSPIAAETLAAHANTDVTLIQRCFRVLAVSGIVTEPTADSYAHGTLSRLFHPDVLGCSFVVFMDFAKAWVHLPDYVKSHKPGDLFDPKKSPSVFAEGREDLGKTYFEILELDAEHRDIWNRNLMLLEKGMPILGMFPFASLKEQVEKEPERPFLVDIAGGRGQACLAIMDEVGGSFGAKVILQELPSVVGDLKPRDIVGIEPMVYDAFTEQPVKNAHVYLMRRFLHDFYSTTCIEFVKNTAMAMGPDSRLLICDALVPDKVEEFKNPELYWVDFALMCMSGKEKKLVEFEEIFEAAGLELVKIHHSSTDRTVMLEARLKRT